MNSSTASGGSPVFIGGIFKSGTSLVRAMLGQHSSFFAGLETQWMKKGDSPEGETALREWQGRISQFFEFPEAELVRLTSGLTCAESRLTRIMDAQVQRLGCKRWVEKTPENLQVMDRIFRHWPMATFLHVIRDPRDVFASLREAGKLKTTGSFANLWCDFMEPACDFLEAQPEGADVPYHEVRYENLVRRPKATMESLLTLLGESYEDRASSFRGQPEDWEKVYRATARKSTTLSRLARPLSRDRMGLGRNRISEREWRAVRQAVISRGLGEELDRASVRLGDGNPAHAVLTRHSNTCRRLSG